MRAGFFTILKALAQAYQTEREKVLETAADLTQALARAGAKPAEGLPGAEVLENIVITSYSIHYTKLYEMK